MTADPAGAVERGAGLLGQGLAQGVGLHAGGPDLGDGVDALGAAVLELHLEAALVDLGDHAAEHHLDAELLELLLGLLAELGTEGRQHLRRGVDEDDARLPGVDRAEVLAQRVVRQLGDLAGHLHAGRTGADDDEGQQVVDVVTAGGTELGHLEGAEDAAAELEGVVDALHAGRELGEVVVAEVGLAGTGRHEQGVVRRDGVAAQHLRGDRPGSEVDAGDLAQDHPGVVLTAEDLAGRRGDLALGQDARRDLVEQRLEEVVRGLRDDGDVDVGAAQGLRAEEPAEAGTDHDHPVSRCLRRAHRSSFLGARSRVIYLDADAATTIVLPPPTSRRNAGRVSLLTSTTQSREKLVWLSRFELPRAGVTIAPLDCPPPRKESQCR